MSAKDMAAGAVIAGAGYAAAKVEQTYNRWKWKNNKKNTQVSKGKGGKK